ncbi:MAG TPA: phosphoribosyltransferase [Burkholderiaceae bacterium]|nr:phosphoribosyltransferase [Burkholderiaceae bacterium]
MKSLLPDRAEAGRRLGRLLAAMPGLNHAVVMALPRGGVPVGAEVARALGAPLDLLLVRKIGAPWQPELAVAAVVDGSPPQTVIDEAFCTQAGIDPRYIQERLPYELREIERRRQVYLRGRAPVDVAGATVIVVDDGIATGTTVRAALKALRRRHPRRLVLAVPVAPAEALQALRGEVDEIVCLEQPFPFHAIGAHYGDFHQVSDQEVIAALQAAAPGDTP